MFRAFENMFDRWKMRLRGKNGQSMLEFAMVFPFFLMAIYGILYFGFLFADYITLNDIARSTARTASMSTDSTKHIKAKQLAKTKNLPSAALNQPIFLFVTDGTQEGKATYDIDRADHNVTVTIQAPLNDKVVLAKLFQTFLNFRWNDGSGQMDAGNELPFRDGLSVTYTMYDETKSSSGS